MPKIDLYRIPLTVTRSTAGNGGKTLRAREDGRTDMSAGSWRAALTNGNIHPGARVALVVEEELDAIVAKANKPARRATKQAKKPRAAKGKRAASRKARR